MTTLSLFTNRATAKLAADAASGDTALTLVPGGGAWFPAPAANQFFRLVLQKGSGQTDQREYMVCTGRTADVLTVTRAQEGTPAANFTAGDEVSLVITGITASSFVQKAGSVLQGALEVEASPTTPLGIATKQFVESGRLPDAPSDGTDYARRDAAWHALGAAAGLAIPIPVDAGGTGGITLAAAQTNLVIGLTTIDDLPPATPKYGDRWVRPANMSEMIWVPNAGGGGAGAWINPADASSEAYPIAIAKGGTGATTLAQAQINLGIGAAASFNVIPITAGGTGQTTAALARTALGVLGTAGGEAMTGVLKLVDGTVNAPGLAFASQPGLGMFRSAADEISWASNGQRVGGLESTAAGTTWRIQPRVANVVSQVILANQPYGPPDFNGLILRQDGDGHASLIGMRGGTAPARDIVISGWTWARFSGVNVVAPRFTLPSETSAWTESATQVFLSMATTWYWDYTKATGNLRWTRGGANLPTDFPAAGGIHTNGGNFNTGAGRVDAASGMGFVYDGSNSNFLMLGADTTWSFQYIRSTGSLNWLRPAGAGGRVTTFAPNGDFVGGRDIYTDSGGSTCLLGTNSTGGFPQLKFTGDGWRLEWSAGVLAYYAPGGAKSVWMDGSGNLNVASQGWKPGGGAWADNSDARVKENIEPYTTGLDAILGLEPVSFTFKAETGRDPGKRYTRLIAQQAMRSMPELVTVAPGALGDIELDDMHILDESPVTWALVNAIKTLHEKLEASLARIAQLEAA